MLIEKTLLPIRSELNIAVRNLQVHNSNIIRVHSFYKAVISIQYSFQIKTIVLL